MENSADMTILKHGFSLFISTILLFVVPTFANSLSPVETQIRQAIFQEKHNQLLLLKQLVDINSGGHINL